MFKQTRAFESTPLGRLPVAIAAIGIALTLGCNRSAPTETDHETRAPSKMTSSEGKPLSARQVLEQMGKVYRSAQRYSDQGMLHQRVVLDGQTHDESADFSLAFERPTKIRLHAYQAGVVCDGQHFRATLADLRGQVLEMPSPNELTFEFIHRDPTLGSVLAGGLAGGSPPLALLLTDEAVPAMLDQPQPPEFLAPESVEGRECHRVRIQRPQGQLVAWIDRETFLLRRLDYPVEGLRSQYAQQGNVGDVQVWAEFRSAEIGTPIDPVAFQFECPPDAQRVSQLVMVPEPPAPSALLGKAIGEFRFTDLDGQNVTRESLGGKIVVLAFWATWGDPSVQTLPALEQVAKHFADNDRVRVLAVSVDAPQTESAKLVAKLAEAGVDLTVLRDPAAQARDVFQVPGIPNLFVVGADGTVEHNEIGFNPKLADELQTKLEKLLAGESVFGEAQQKYQAQLADYRRDLEAQQQAAADPQGIPRAKIAERRLPETLKVDALWSNTDVKRPGNVLLIAGLEAENREDSLQAIVVEAFKGVALLDAQGQITAHHAFDIPSQTVVSYVRATRDAEGAMHYLASAVNQPLVHRFDGSWKRVQSYPEGENAEVMDAQFFDANADGRPEIAVGFWGVVGVHLLAADGKVEWRNRSMENVFRLAVLGDADQPRIWCAQSRGTLLPINADGEQQADLTITGRFVRSIVATDLDHDGQQEYAGLAISNAASEDLLGLGSQGVELWSYPLPPGVHEQPVEMISAGPVLPGNEDSWIVATADGTLHFVDRNGKLIDQFRYGENLCGVATARFGERVILVVSTPERIDAWAVSPR